MATTESAANQPLTPPSPTEPIEPEKDLSELISELTSDIGNLVSTHIELAKVEIKDEVKKAGLGAGLLSGAGVAAVFALLLLSFALAWGLHEIMPEGFAFLIVGLLWAAAAAVMALMGKDRIKRVKGPEQTIDEVKEDAQWARQQRT